MKDEVIFTKVFNLLEGLQEAQTLQYELLEDENSEGESFYGIALISSAGDKIIRDAWRYIFEKYSDCMKVITYLYENAALLSNWRDIVADLSVKLGD